MSNVIPQDKLLHIAAGAAIAAAAMCIMPSAAALAVTALVALEKERHDGRHPEVHTSDGWDAYATLVGGVLVMLVVDLARTLLG